MTILNPSSSYLKMFLTSCILSPSLSKSLSAFDTPLHPNVSDSVDGGMRRMPHAEKRRLFFRVGTELLYLSDQSSALFVSRYIDGVLINIPVGRWTFFIDC